MIEKPGRNHEQDTRSGGEATAAKGDVALGCGWPDAARRRYDIPDRKASDRRSPARPASTPDHPAWNCFIR